MTNYKIINLEIDLKNEKFLFKIEKNTQISKISKSKYTLTNGTQYENYDISMDFKNVIIGKLDKEELKTLEIFIELNQEKLSPYYQKIDLFDINQKSITLNNNKFKNTVEMVVKDNLLYSLDSKIKSEYEIETLYADKKIFISFMKNEYYISKYKQNENLDVIINKYPAFLFNTDLKNGVYSTDDFYIEKNDKMNKEQFKIFDNFNVFKVGKYIKIQEEFLNEEKVTLLDFNHIFNKEYTKLCRYLDKEEILNPNNKIEVNELCM